MENNISIHALREEGDLDKWRQIMHDPLIFLSTPSARRATSSGSWKCSCILISIHALREEGDAGRADPAAE